MLNKSYLSINNIRITYSHKKNIDKNLKNVDLVKKKLAKNKKNKLKLKSSVRTVSY